MNPGDIANHTWIAIINAFRGSIREAVATCDSLSSTDNPFPEAIAYIYAVGGRRDEALRVLRDLREEDTRHYVDPARFATVYAGLGDKEQAIASLRKALEVRSPMIVFLKVEPFLDGLRSDPRFQDLLRKTGPPPVKS